MRPRLLLSSATLAAFGLLGCAHGAWQAPAPEVRGPMPMCTAPAVERANWSPTLTPDSSIVFHLPPHYRPRNAYGSWNLRDRFPLLPGGRDFTLRLAASGSSLREMAGDPRMDRYELAYWTACSVAVGERTVRVETAWMRGGLGGWPWGRYISVEHRLANGQAIYLQGEAGDEAGLRELLAIALTAEARH